MLAPLQRLDNLLESVDEDIAVVLLESQHGTQTDGGDTAAANVDAKLLGLGEELVTFGAVKGDESALALAAEVLEVVGVLGGELLNLAVEVVADAGGVVDEVEALHLLNDGTEDEAASRVTHPGVELAVGLVGAQVLGGVVVAGGLSLLGEGDHVGRVLEIPVLVRPELASGANAGLDLVGNEEDVVLAGEGAELLEELGAGVVVAALGLDGLDHDGGGGQVPGGDEVLNLVEGGLLGLAVLLDVVLERVLELGEGGLGPVKGGDVELVDGLGAGGGEGAKEAAVKGRLEGEDGQLGGAGGLVVHARGQLLLAKVDVGAAALALAAVHEGGLVGELVGVGAGEGRVDVVEALGGNLEDAGAQDLGPVVGGEVAEGRTVDEGVDHLGRGGGLGEVLIVVAHGDGGNLSVAAFQLVAAAYNNEIRGQRKRTHRAACCRRSRPCSCRHSWCSQPSY